MKPWSLGEKGDPESPAVSVAEICLLAQLSLSMWEPACHGVGGDLHVKLFKGSLAKIPEGPGIQMKSGRKLLDSTVHPQAGSHSPGCK